MLGGFLLSGVHLVIPAHALHLEGVLLLLLAELQGAADAAGEVREDYTGDGTPPAMLA